MLGPISVDKTDLLMAELYRELHCKMETCVVCDQLCASSAGKLTYLNKLPANFFSKLMAPSDSPTCHSLHPMLLAQYSVPELLKMDNCFENLLISPRGVKLHNDECVCSVEICRCEPLFFICERFGCCQALERGSLPKCSIANGNWIGILPEEVRRLFLILYMFMIRINVNSIYL